MKEKLYTLLFFLLVTISGKAQDFNPGPEVQNLTERKNVTVDYATGLFHYTVPLYQLKSGDYELPISLDYIAKGVKVSDPEGLIGKNWTLNVGGIVTRTMRGGFADEKSGYGYLWTENAVTPLEQDARTVGLRKRDGESDIFTVVFNGKKVDFIIRMNENKQIYALPLGQTDIRIECEGTSTEITGWAITDNNGDRYIYRQRERCMDVEYVDVSTSNAISDSGYTSAWHLTRILPYNGAPIDFHYNGDATSQLWDNLPAGCMNTMKIGDSYKMTYHYGESVKEQPFDFEQYRSKFDNAVAAAQHYLEMSSLGISFESIDIKIRDFEKYGYINIQPLHSEYIKTNNRIVGILSNISQMAGVSIGLEQSLRDMSRVCNNMDNFYANLAGMYLQEAADYIHACLSETRYVREKEMCGGNSCTIVSPLLNMIVCPEYIVKFVYSSSPLRSYLSAVTLHNRNMEQVSSVSIIGGVHEVSFLDKDSKKIYDMKFDYYEKTDFLTCKEEGKDLWGYPVGRNEDEECEMYATLYSLKNIILSDGGKIEIRYERNKASGTTVGGIRLKSLVFDDRSVERNDTIYYGYPEMAMSVYKSYSNFVIVSYPNFDDRIDYDRVQPEGHPVVNLGNNGFYYPCVTETVSGKGTTTYSYEVASSSPTSISPYPYWLNGLLTEKSVYDLNGKLLKKIQYNYEIDNNSGDKLPQMQPSNFYLDEESLEPFFKKQGTPYLTGEEMYRLNIEPRLSPANVDRFYNLQYGWKIVLKEEVEDRSDEDIPYCQTRYCYDNSLSIYPTRIIRIGSDGIEHAEVLKRVMDMADRADPVFIDMKKANLLLPIVKSITLIDGKLISESVFRFQADKEAKVGSIAPVEKLTYVPIKPEIYVPSSIDTQLFNYGENNYTIDASYQYASQKVSRMWVEIDGRTERNSRAYDNYGKLLLECNATGVMASDECKLVLNPETDLRAIYSTLKQLEKPHREFSSIMQMIADEVYDDQFSNFQRSHDNYVVVTFAEKILKSEPDLIWARIYYKEVVRNDYEIFNVFKREYERIIELYPKYKDLRRFIYPLETLVHYNEQELFDLYFLDYEIERPMHTLDYSLTLIPDSDTQNLRLYILDGSATASGIITHAGSDTSYIVESVSSSKLKIYDIDLSKYTDIISVTVNNQGSYMALVPEGANFKATSYNPDGTVYARFDQSGNVEYYTYDAAGRVIKVEDQYGNILKTYEYNKLNN